MQPKFGIERERQNHLFYKEYTNDKGAFHFHSQIELYFVDAGEMEVFVNQQRRMLQAGQMSVALSYDAHAYRTPQQSRSSVLIIPPYACQEFIAAIRNKRVLHPFITDREKVAEIKRCIQQMHQQHVNEITQRGYLYVILGMIMDHVGFEALEEPIDTQLSSRLLFYINDNFKTTITLASLAAHFGYSESYLSRYFKSCFGIGINQYLAIVRLKNVLTLMQEPENSITYCAFESGFNSMRTFYRVFYQEFQCTPREYLAHPPKAVVHGSAKH